MFLSDTASVINAPILRHIPQILPDISVEQQVYIVNWRIVHQPFQLAALEHIPRNLGFHQGAVNGDHASIGVFDLNAGGTSTALV